MGRLSGVGENYFLEGVGGRRLGAGMSWREKIG